jgi:hypothetical protein
MARGKNYYRTPDLMDEFSQSVPVPICKRSIQRRLSNLWLSTPYAGVVKSLRIYPIYIGYLNSIRHHTKKGT